MSTPKGNVPDIETIKSQAYRPKRAVITAGMPYANKPLHLGHLAGVHVPADIYARWMRMLIGAENVLFVCGSDDHGSISEIGAIEAGKSVRDFIDGMHKEQRATLVGLGLNKLHRSVEVEATPEVMGQVRKVQHLVDVEQAA